MKRTQKKWLGTGVLSSAVRRGAERAFFLAVLTASASAAFGAATYTTEDDGATLVVTVDADGATLETSQIVAGVTKIRKAGPGKLTSTNIASFTGDIDITDGIWCATDAGHFGATSTTAPSGTVDVRDGASIEYAGTNAKPGCLSGKTVNLYGNPASGGFANGASGKIVLSENVTLQEPGLGRNMVVNLVDSDTLFWSRNRLRIRGTLNLGGHKLALRYGAHDLGGFVTNGGVLSIDSTLMTEGTNLVFAADCAANAYVEIGSGGTLNLKSVRTVANGWTLRNNGGSMTSNQKRTYTDPPLGAWDGPVVFAGDSKVANYSGSESIPTTVFDLFGDLSGESGSLKIGPGWLNLHSAVNTYAGAVTVTSVGNAAVPAGAGGIGIFGGASCFPNASSVVFGDSSSLIFMDDEPSSHPKLAFAGDKDQMIGGRYLSVHPVVAGLSKTGSGELAVKMPIRVTGKTEIAAGRLKISATFPGLKEYHVTPKTSGEDEKYIFSSDQDKGFCRPWESRWREHINIEEKGVNLMGAGKAMSGAVSSGWGDGTTLRNGWWYSGYIWNRSTSPATCKMWAGMTTGVSVWLGSDHSTQLEFRGNNGKPAYAQEVVLQPGATPIDIFVWGHKDELWSFYFKMDGGGKRYGFCYAIADTTFTTENFNAEIDKLPTQYSTSAYQNGNVQDFVAMADQFSAFGDGGTEKLCSSVYGGDETVSLDEVYSRQPVLDDFCFTYGAMVDLDGNRDFRIGKLTGSPMVVNAVKMTVTNCWTVCAADFPKADASVRRPLTIDGQLAFAAGAKVAIDDDSLIERSTSGIVIATATGGVAGKPVAADGRWKVVVRGNDVVLNPRGGLMLIVR